MAKGDYFPTRVGDQRNWLQNFITQLPTVGPALGMTPTEVTDCTAAAGDVIAAIDAAIAAENAARNAVSNRDSATATALTDVIRPAMKRVKTTSAYTTGQGELLGIEGSSIAPDYSTYKPVLNLEMAAQQVLIKWKKLKADGINIYKQNERGEWIKLAFDARPNYLDKSALPPAGTSQIWTYKAVYVVDDAEVGLFSEPTSITVKGEV